MSPYSWAIRLITPNQEKSPVIEEAIVEEETSLPSWASEEPISSTDVEIDSNEELAPW